MNFLDLVERRPGKKESLVAGFTETDPSLGRLTGSDEFDDDPLAELTVTHVVAGFQTVTRIDARRGSPACNNSCVDHSLLTDVHTAFGRPGLRPRPAIFT